MDLIPNYFYYCSIVLQALCLWHSFKRGTQQKWIWIIVFLPYVGSIIYFFSEIVNGNQLNKVQSGVGSFINPSGGIRKLENQLKFSDTFQNRVALADAYLANGYTDKAIELYEKSYVGVFTENEQLLSGMIAAYYETGRYTDIFPLARKLYKTPQFLRSRIHMLYAMALGQNGNLEEAEKEFKVMNSKFSCFEQRYHYGLFLQRTGREAEAHALYSEILNEASHLGPRERRDNRKWFNATREALKSMQKATV